MDGLLLPSGKQQQLLRFLLSLSGIVVQLSISPGGVPKTPVDQAEVRHLGIVGDAHRNRKLHGGPGRALLLLASETIESLQAEGWPVFFGALGENVTTGGLDPSLWRTGQRYSAGSLVFELTTPRPPCRNLNTYGTGIQQRIFHPSIKRSDFASPYWGLSGFYATVIVPGIVQKLDIIRRLDT